MGRGSLLPVYARTDNGGRSLQSDFMSELIALIPAAGTGMRMGTDRPKQYRDLLGRPMLLWTAARLCAQPRLREVYVVLAPDDRLFAGLDVAPFGGRLQPLHCGGETRAHTVANALAAIHSKVRGDDWILVHDAARPCVTVALLDRLIGALCDDDVGGLLAVPVADTLKRADAAQRVAATVSRAGFWQAQTPQMFRYALLRRALAAAELPAITDEAGAIEALGLQPKLVAGSGENIKVTYPQDFALAEAILRMQGEKQ